MNKTRILSCYFFMFVSLSLSAQNAAPPQMADVLRSNGKIYTVVAVVGIVLTGLLVYLFLTDRKLTKIEKELEDRNVK